MDLTINKNNFSKPYRSSSLKKEKEEQIQNKEEQKPANQIELNIHSMEIMENLPGRSEGNSLNFLIPGEITSSSEQHLADSSSPAPPLTHMKKKDDVFPFKSSRYFKYERLYPLRNIVSALAGKSGIVLGTSLIVHGSIENDLTLIIAGCPTFLVGLLLLFSAIHGFGPDVCDVLGPKMARMLRYGSLSSWILIIAGQGLFISGIDKSSRWLRLLSIVPIACGMTLLSATIPRALACSETAHGRMIENEQVRYYFRLFGNGVSGALFAMWATLIHPTDLQHNHFHTPYPYINETILALSAFIGIFTQALNLTKSLPGHPSGVPKLNTISLEKLNQFRDTPVPAES